jgi:heterodisulfide reductase subunit A-like polyferredoxin
MLDVGRHPNIELMAYSEVEKVEGEAGDFKVTVRRKARYVDEDKCTGCGACTEKCPTLLPDAFNGYTLNPHHRCGELPSIAGQEMWHLQEDLSG